MGTPVLDQVGFEMIVYVAEISGRGIAALTQPTTLKRKRSWQTGDSYGT